MENLNKTPGQKAGYVGLQDVEQVEREPVGFHIDAAYCLQMLKATLFFLNDSRNDRGRNEGVGDAYAKRDKNAIGIIRNTWIASGLGEWHVGRGEF